MNTLAVIIASYFIAIPLSVTLYILFTMPRSERFRFAALLIVGGVLSLLIAKLGNIFIHDPRPFMVGHFEPLIISSRDNGFPSDHTLLASFLGFAVLGRSKIMGAILLVVALAIGLARMYAGVHHSWDVLGSFIITGISYVVARAVVGYVIRRRATRAV